MSPEILWFLSIRRLKCLEKKFAITLLYVLFWAPMPLKLKKKTHLNEGLQPHSPMNYQASDKV